MRVCEGIPYMGWEEASLGIAPSPRSWTSLLSSQRHLLALQAMRMDRYLLCTQA